MRPMHPQWRRATCLDSSRNRRMPGSAPRCVGSVLRQAGRRHYPRQAGGTRHFHIHHSEAHLRAQRGFTPLVSTKAKGRRRGLNYLSTFDMLEPRCHRLGTTKARLFVLATLAIRHLAFRILVPTLILFAGRVLDLFDCHASPPPPHPLLAPCPCAQEVGPSP